jgi:hypothetical protein
VLSNLPLGNLTFGNALRFAITPPMRYPRAMRKRIIVGLLGVVLCACITLPSQDAKPSSPVAPEDSLVLTAGQASVTFTPTDVRALPHVPLTVHNGHTDAAETYSGVPLAVLLAKVHAPLGKDLRGKAMTNYVIAAGSDGYLVVLSLAEVDPDFHAGQVMVADTRDGHPLGKNGPFQLIVSQDKRPARWVHNLVAIDLQKAR